MSTDYLNNSNSYIEQKKSENNTKIYGLISNLIKKIFLLIIYLAFGVYSLYNVKISESKIIDKYQNYIKNKYKDNNISSKEEIVKSLNLYITETPKNNGELQTDKFTTNGDGKQNFYFVPFDLLKNKDDIHKSSYYENEINFQKYLHKNINNGNIYLYYSRVFDALLGSNEFIYNYFYSFFIFKGKLLNFIIILLLPIFIIYVCVPLLIFINYGLSIFYHFYYIKCLFMEKKSSSLEYNKKWEEKEWQRDNEPLNYFVFPIKFLYFLLYVIPIFFISMILILILIIYPLFGLPGLFIYDLIQKQGVFKYNSFINKDNFFNCFLMNTFDKYKYWIYALYVIMIIFIIIKNYKTLE